MQTEIFTAVDKLFSGQEIRADFNVRPGTHDPNIVQEIWNQHFYSGAGYEIKPGDVVVDIGAHIGSFMVWAIMQGADVNAYEPDKDNFDLLEMNTRANAKDRGGIRLYNKALTGTAGEYFIDHGATGQLNTGGYSVSENPFGENVEKIETWPAEAIFENVDKIDFLKVDCEGSEYHILASFTDEQWAKIDKIVMEWHIDFGWAEKLRDLLANKNFTITEFTLNPDAVVPIGRLMAKK